MVLESVGRSLARFLSQSRDKHESCATCDPERLRKALKKGDVLLVEGNTRISAAIKYLTQSSWSHAALYVGDAVDPEPLHDASRVLLEVDINEGVRVVPLAHYSARHTRICRPVGLSPTEIDKVVNHALTRLGDTYDLKNITDLARFLIPTPPVPSRWRKHVLAIGSGEPTRAICSSLIAEAFQSIPYPILPYVHATNGTVSQGERLSVRHHSLFTPRDFDVSPYFKIIKPTLEKQFDPHDIEWDTAPPDPSTA